VALDRTAFITVGFGLIGRMVWLESDLAWEHSAGRKGSPPTLAMR
jgi:hypothetical protein